MTNQANLNLSSVEKALNIMLCFNSGQAELGTTEISAKTGLPKSTASRLIKTLVTARFLRQNAETKKYLFGSSAYQLGIAAAKSMNSRLLAIAQPYLQNLAETTNESVALELLTGFDVVLAMHVEGPGHLRFNFQRGELVPINVAAGAKVILAHHEADFVETCLHRDFHSFNENTITSKEEYRKLLRKIRKEGVAFDRGERYLDIRAMAAPIINPLGPPIAAVIIAGPTSRLTESFLGKVKPKLLNTVEMIGKSLYADSVDDNK